MPMGSGYALQTPSLERKMVGTVVLQGSPRQQELRLAQEPPVS